MTSTPPPSLSESISDSISDSIDTPSDDRTDSNVSPSASSSQDPTKDPTYVKLAMRNMVRQGSKSLFHFALTIVGLLGVLVGLAFITR